MKKKQIIGLAIICFVYYYYYNKDINTINILGNFVYIGLDKDASKLDSCFLFQGVKIKFCYLVTLF
jgi:hypothetical protein